MHTKSWRGENEALGHMQEFADWINEDVGMEVHVPVDVNDLLCELRKRDREIGCHLSQWILLFVRSIM